MLSAVWPVSQGSRAAIVCCTDAKSTLDPRNVAEPIVVSLRRQAEHIRADQVQTSSYETVSKGQLCKDNFPNANHKRSSRHPLPKMPLLHLTRERLQQLVEVGLAPIRQLAAPLRVAQGVQVVEERARYLDEGGALLLQLGA